MMNFYLNSNLVGSATTGTTIGLTLLSVLLALAILVALFLVWRFFLSKKKLSSKENKIQELENNLASQTNDKDKELWKEKYETAQKKLTEKEFQEKLFLEAQEKNQGKLSDLNAKLSLEKEERFKETNSLKSELAIFENKKQAWQEQTNYQRTQIKSESEKRLALEKQVASLETLNKHHEKTLEEQKNQISSLNETININNKTIKEKEDLIKIKEAEAEKKFKEIFENKFNEFSKEQRTILSTMNEVSTKISAELSRPVNELRDLFINSNRRGHVGEITLENILRQILGVEGEMWESQPHITPNDNNRPDFVIKYSDVKIYIDSKFINDHDDDATIFKNFENHIKKVSKTYIEPYNLDFFIIYIPSETIFARIYAIEKAREAAWKAKVVIASPSTIILLVLTIRGFGLRFNAMQDLKVNLEKMEKANKYFIEWSESWNDFRKAFASLIDNKFYKVDTKARKLHSSYINVAKTWQLQIENRMRPKDLIPYDIIPKTEKEPLDVISEETETKNDKSDSPKSK